MSVITHIIIASLILEICISYNSQDARILEWVNERFPEGGYHFRYLTSNGLAWEETGVIAGNQDKSFLKVSGFYSYIDNNGKTVKKYYEADEDGSKLKYENFIPPFQPPETNPHYTPIPSGVIASLAGGGIG